CEISPAALRIHQAFVDRGETVANDHIALRTLNHPRLGIKSLAKQFENFGYKAVQDYTFVEKKLSAWHFEHGDDSSLPKIFISELQLEKLSPHVQETMIKCAEQVTDE